MRFVSISVAATPAASSLPGSADSSGSDPGLGWALLVGVCTGGWILLFAAIDPLEARFPDWILGLGIIAIWFGIPVGIYLDARRTRAVSEWPNYPKTVTLLSAVWFLNIVVGCWYLAKRYRVAPFPDPSSTEANRRPRHTHRDGAQPAGSGDESHRPADTAWPDADDSAAESDLETRLAALSPPAFAQFVADLRSTWGWECTILEDADGGPGIDIVAIDEADETCTVIRTLHCGPDERVPPAALPDADALARRVTPPADSVLVVTNGRFDTDSAWLAGDYTLLDGDDLCELLAEADADVDALLPVVDPNPW